MAGITQILSDIQQGDQHAAEQLLPLVYEELRKLAAQRLAGEKPGQTLQATALVHEAYVRLVDVDKAQQWNTRGHFFAAAAEAMRRILVDQARRKQTVKHGVDRLRIDLPEDLAVPDARSGDLVALDEALSRLERHDGVRPALARFAGLSPGTGRPGHQTPPPTTSGRGRAGYSGVEIASHIFSAQTALFHLEDEGIALIGHHHGDLEPATRVIHSRALRSPASVEVPLGVRGTRRSGPRWKPCWKPATRPVSSSFLLLCLGNCRYPRSATPRHGHRP
jgi:RNA polymerase sigma factor (TIGR02999 family)